MRAAKVFKKQENNTVPSPKDKLAITWKEFFEKYACSEPDFKLDRTEAQKIQQRNLFEDFET